VTWHLVLRKGLPSADGKHKFAHEEKFDLGMRQPMEVTGAHAENRLNHGRKIHVKFSRAMPRDPKDPDLSDWLVVDEEFKRIDPQTGQIKLTQYKPTKVEYEISTGWRSLQIEGGFKLGQTYRVRVKPGLPSRLGLKFTGEWSDTFVFRPLPSRIYLPDTLTSQTASGHRQFGFVSVNNHAVRLRVKRIEPGRLLEVLKAYRQEYLGRDQLDWGGQWIWRRAQPLNFDLVPGREVYEHVYRQNMPVDRAVKEEFTWDEVLGNDQPGPLFVSVECVGKDGSASNAQAVVQFTDIGLTWKEAGGEMFVHAFSLRTAEPLASAAVQIFDANHKPLAKAHTDAQGNVRLNPNVKNKDGGRPNRWVTVSHQGDEHAMELDRYYTRMRLWTFGIYRGWGEPKNLKTHLFTDRLIYQPGDTVRLKGHVREWGEGKLRIPRSLTLPAEVRDSRDHVIFSEQIEVSEQGSFDFEIPLAKGVSGGHVIEVGDERLYISVYEYEPATFKVRFTSSSQFAPEDPVEVKMRAGYYFGKPLAGAKVNWTFNGGLGRHWPSGWDEYHFGAYQLNDEISLTGEGALSADGELTIKPELPTNEQDNAPLRGRVSVRITNENEQTITGSTAITRHSSDFYLGLRRMPNVLWAGKPLTVKVVAVNPMGQPAETGTDFTATLNKIEWHSVKFKGAGGTVRYRNERKVKFIDQAILKTIDREADPMPVALTPRVSGQYELVLRAKDSEGRSMLTSGKFYVSGEQPQAWDYSDEFKMEMEPDKSTYVSGDTAILLLKTPISGRALVTVEREKVLRSFHVEVSGNAPVIHVPLKDLDAPNVFVSVLLLRGSEASTRKIKTAEYRLGYCELKVESPGSRLKVKTSLSQSDYRPGQKVESTVQVTDHIGQSVPGAEVTLYAVDEGILDLTGYSAPDLHTFFHTPRPLEVSTASSFPVMRTEDPSRVHYGNKGHIIGDGGGSKGRLRRNFLAVAFWNATLQTDAQGIARVSFTAPDSLTRYRLFAVVHTAEQFGTGETGFRINQPLMVESALPRFGRIGDNLEAKAMVYNQTDRPINAIVKLELDEFIIAKNETERRVTVPAQGSLAVTFPLEFAAVGTARTVWRVHSIDAPELNDARETFIDIRHVAPLRRAIHFSRVQDAEVDLLKPIDPALRQAEGTFTVGVSSSPLAEVMTAADYLLTYPHGCVEQTSSSLLPWLLLEDFEDVFPKLNKDAPKSKDAIEYGVNRLFSMQAHNGGFGYWPGGTASNFGSAYAGMVLAIAKSRGHTVPSRPMEGLKKYLIKFVKRPVNGKWAWREHCLALYTLTLLDAPQAAIHEKTYSERDKIPEGARALLAMAIAKINGPDEMIEALLKANDNKEIRAYEYYWNGHQELATRLMARCLQDATHPKAAQIAGMITDASREGHWGTTFGNAWVLYALATYDRQVAVEDTVSGTLVFGDQEHAFVLNEKKRSAAFTFKNAADPNERPLFLRKNGKGTLFVRVKAAMYPTKSQTFAISQGLSLTRTYTRLKDNGQPDPDAPLRVGDLVRVSLKLDVPKPTSYLAIEDGLPACLEPVNLRLRTQRSNASTKSNWFINHQVLRKDRAVFYVNQIGKGVQRFEYLARVRAAGQSTAPAAKAEAMYDPDTIGLSASQHIVTLPLNE
jgi:uncharacterized protein YfaS (alpha-2-macroglobulin family)